MYLWAPAGTHAGIGVLGAGAVVWIWAFAFFSPALPGFSTARRADALLHASCIMSAPPFMRDRARTFRFRTP
ncbi:hypothetical protein K458DRAFT_422196 [Lentithecium fluviatile CBS 122367]|uniref:Uncharacterized protein n=1 Tax=Lentithecium fluviatile CBS 122367 TaxID=1168545 RepID=A0A6G1IND2_9PLEO|nr:hypothetical protein K458DRAFT_422196 [Lentithecium fluviatile CBS 122367]